METMKPIKTFPISVKGGIATYEGTEKLVCGNKRYQAEFAFDAEWDDYSEIEKKAKFKVYRNGRYESLVIGFKGNVCPIPALYNVTELRVGVFIEDGISTTSAAVIPCLLSINCGTSKSMLTLDEIKAMNEALRGEDGKDYVLTEADKKEIAELAKAKVAKIGEVTLLASKWGGENNLYSQVVDIEGVTEYSQVDLTPDVQQLAIFYNKDITFVTENEDGVVTVYVIGQKPENDYTIQVTITEVNI